MSGPNVVLLFSVDRAVRPSQQYLKMSKALPPLSVEALNSYQPSGNEHAK